MEHNGSLKPRPLVEWLCPDTLIDQVCKLTSQDQRQNPRLGQLVREAVRKYHSSDSLRAILEYEQAQLAQQVAARVEPGRLREIALALRRPQGPPEPPAAPTTVRDPDAETIIWNTLETALAAEDQEERHEWAGINTVRLEAPELFMAVQDELRNYQGPDRLHWEIDAELERISQQHRRRA